MSARAATRSTGPEPCSPFLREAAQRFPNVADRFVGGRSASGGRRALEAAGEDVGEQLRRQRHGLALAVALGDLSGEQPLEWVTATLSDFADSAMDEALRAAMRSGSGRGAARAGGPRAGQAWQPRAQLFVRRRPRPAVRSRDLAAAAARRAGRGGGALWPAVHRAAAAAHRRRLCRAGRPAPAAVARGDADRPAGRCRHQLL